MAAMNALAAYARTTPTNSTQPAPDRSSLLRQIAGKVLSPLAAVGNVLDLPGSSVRDLITGQNPFDQYMTPFREDNRTTGRDVLTHLGVTAPNDPHRWEWADAGGLLTEMATDPLTFVSGLGSGVGKALQGTGKASHLFKVGLPFTKGAMPVGKAAAGLLDSAAAKGWATNVPFTGGATLSDAADAVTQARRGLFDYSVGGAFDKVGQTFNSKRTELAEGLGPDAFEEAQRLKDVMIPVEDEFLKTVSHLPADQGQEMFDRVLSHTLEIAGRAGEHKKAFNQAYQEIVGSPAAAGLDALAEAPLKEWASTIRKTVDKEREWGAKIGVFDKDNIAYTVRAANKKLLEKQGKSVSHGGLYAHENSAGREDILAGVPQEYLRRMLTDTSLGGKSKYIGNSPLGGGAAIEGDFGKYLGYETTDPTTFKKATVPAKEHAQQLAEYLGSLEKQGIEAIHEVAPVGLMERRQASSARIIANMQATHETFADAIKAGATGKTITLKEAYQKVGMDPKRAVEKYAALNSIPADQAARLQVGADLVDRIAGISKFTDNPAWLEFLGTAIDKFNDMFKSNVTIPFPAFHIRNWLSGQHMNVASGHVQTPRDLARYMKAYKKAMEIRDLGVADPLIREAMAHKVLGSKQAFEDVTLRGTSDIGPGLAQSPVKGYAEAKEFVADPENANPIMDAIPGGKAARVGYNTVMNTGSNIAQTAEYYNRMTMYVYLREGGMSPAKAAKEVEKLHFDYSKLTPFERGAMRRMVPFYTFSRKITPQILSMLVDRPGGPIAQTIRASNAGRDPEDVQMPLIAATAAVPLNPLDDGTKRYLTGFGLAPEAAMPYIGGAADPQGALLNAGASLTPLAKYPLEAMTGQAFFQRGSDGAGRKLNDMDPSIGRLLSNVRNVDNPTMWAGGNRSATMGLEHLIGNTPITKYINTARTLTDKRKWQQRGVMGLPDAVTNILTPLNVTAVSPAQQEKLIQTASNKLADAMGAGTWTNRYFSKDNLDRMNSEERRIALLLKDIWAESKRKAAKAKNARPGKTPGQANPLMKAANN